MIWVAFWKLENCWVVSPILKDPGDIKFDNKREAFVHSSSGYGTL